MADLASFSLSDRRAAPHSRAHQYRLTAVSAVIQSAARLELGRTLNNVRGRGEGRGQCFMQRAVMPSSGRVIALWDGHS